MCGRFALHSDGSEIITRFGVQETLFDLKPRYNIAPTQQIAVITQDNIRTLSGYKWGLIPSWAKDTQMASKMINARSETLLEKPSFRKSLISKRCLIPANGFYEWQQVGKSKIPIYVQLKSKKLFAFAALWDEWQSVEGEKIRSTTIITTEPNPLLAKLHHRMAVMLLPEQENIWLDSKIKDPNQLLKLLTQYPESELEYFPVSKLVNNTSFDSPECIKALETLEIQEPIKPIQESFW
ncbi:MAG: SOS response-associated peptidase [Blastocatellia bacterium]|nr:SOS response-associated peptidase [Blastocatellia bacterium]MBN8721883.1 SOS response-associated peptidase [Acidobacteriota bacterium]